MPHFFFGASSQQRLDECHPDLVRVAQRALGYGVMDFAVICGARSTEEQIKAHAEGRSKIDGVTKFSKHQIGGNTGRELADAFDVVPYPTEWNNPLAFHILAGILMVAAAEERVVLRWGGDWNGNFSCKDQSFHDLPHFERVV
jgi:peptidoglycan LD-endopeptidase CwlK